MKLYRQELASSYALTAIIAGVVSIVGTRLFLELTGYPSIGGRTWHLSHTIWGGIIMCAGMFLAMSFYGRKSMRLASATFGFGMGMFFDEIGKFVTRDNNYFFKPSGMMIYIIFLGLFGIYRLLTRRRRENGVHLFYHLIDRLGDLAENDLDEREQKRLLEVVRLLRGRAHYELSAFSDELERALGRLKPKPYYKPVASRITHKIEVTLYKNILSSKGVLGFMILLTFGYSVFSIVDTAWLLANIKNMSLYPNFLGEYLPANYFEAYLLLIKIVSDLAMAGLFLAGIGLVVSRRYRLGLELFEYGLLVNILLTTVARFYFEQFSAGVGLLFSLCILFFVRRLKIEKTA